MSNLVVDDFFFNRPNLGPLLKQINRNKGENDASDTYQAVDIGFNGGYVVMGSNRLFLREDETKKRAFGLPDTRELFVP